MIFDQFDLTFELPLGSVVALFCAFKQYPVSIVVSPSFALSSDDELLTLIFVVARRAAAAVEDVAFVVVDASFFVLPAGAVFDVFCF